MQSGSPAAKAHILIKQSIGRGLRLPYGKRTGVAAVDRLNIVAHDKFQEIIDEANLELSKLDNGDPNRFLDIGPLFLRSDGNINTAYMHDQLHLIEPGYKIWAEAMKYLLDEMM